MNLIKEDLEFKNNRGNPLSPVQQVCLFTSYLGTGSVQWFTATPAGAKKATACDVVKRVSDAISARSHHLIKLPNRAEMREGADRLFDRFRLPDMPLGIDGTHIP